MADLRVIDDILKKAEEAGAGWLSGLRLPKMEYQNELYNNLYSGKCPFCSVVLEEQATPIMRMRTTRESYERHKELKKLACGNCNFSIPYVSVDDRFLFTSDSSGSIYAGGEHMPKVISAKEIEKAACYAIEGFLSHWFQQREWHPHAFAEYAAKLNKPQS